MARLRGPIVVALLLLCSAGGAALDAPAVVPSDAPAEVEGSAAAANRSPSSLLRGLRSAVMPPLKLFASAPPITRSWVSASVVMAVLTSTRIVDARSICFSEPSVIHEGEWWRLATNFFFMGDAVKSVFFWVQLHHFWECCKMLELVKYRWEPADFIKLIVSNAGFLLVLKQLFPSTIFLGTPMVMAFLYTYAREYEMQVMNLLGFFSIRCGWLPFAQMLQDLLQAGDVTPNLLGLMSGHTYFYLSEVMPRLELPKQPRLDEVMALLVHGTPIGAGDEVLGDPAASEGAAADGEVGEGGEDDVEDAGGEGGGSGAAGDAAAEADGEE